MEYRNMEYRKVAQEILSDYNWKIFIRNLDRSVSIRYNLICLEDLVMIWKWRIIEQKELLIIRGINVLKK